MNLNLKKEKEAVKRKPTRDTNRGVSLAQEIGKPITNLFFGKRETRDRLFARIYRDYKNRLYRLTFSFSKNEDEREDMVQEIFYNIFSSLERFKKKSSLTTYIYSIARNTCLVYIKKAVREKEKTAKVRHFFQAKFEECPSKKVLENEQISLFLEVLEKLPDELREVYYLFEVDNLKYREIAGILNIKLGTVKSRLNRAKEILARLLLQTGEEPV